MISSESYLRKRHKEEIDIIISTLDHASEAHTRMSSMCANLSLLAKIMDQETFQMVLKATARPLMQVNIPEHFLNQVEEMKPQTLVEKQMEKDQNAILPKHNMAAME